MKKLFSLILVLVMFLGGCSFNFNEEPPNVKKEIIKTNKELFVWSYDNFDKVQKLKYDLEVKTNVSKNKFQDKRVKAIEMYGLNIEGRIDRKNKREQGIIEKEWLKNDSMEYIEQGVYIDENNRKHYYKLDGYLKDSIKASESRKSREQGKMIEMNPDIMNEKGIYLETFKYHNQDFYEEIDEKKYFFQKPSEKDKSMGAKQKIILQLGGDEAYKYLRNMYFYDYLKEYGLEESITRVVHVLLIDYDGLPMIDAIKLTSEIEDVEAEIIFVNKFSEYDGIVLFDMNPQLAGEITIQELMK